MYFDDDVVVVELSLNGTHKGDLVIPEGVIPPTNIDRRTVAAEPVHGTFRKDFPSCSLVAFIGVWLSLSPDSYERRFLNK